MKIKILTLLFFLFSILYSNNNNSDKIDNKILNKLNNSCIYSVYKQDLPFILTNDNYLGKIYAVCFNKKIILMNQKNKVEYSILEKTNIKCDCNKKEKFKYYKEK